MNCLPDHINNNNYKCQCTDHLPGAFFITVFRNFSIIVASLPSYAKCTTGYSIRILWPSIVCQNMS